MRRMINSAELFVGLRYLRAKRRTRFVSFITLISLAGIALGVAALIVILSVMNGFEGELRDRLLSMTAHGYVTGSERELDAWPQVREQMLLEAGVVSASPGVQMEGMIQSRGDLFAVLVHGVNPDYETVLSGAMINMIEGSLDVLQAGERSIIDVDQREFAIVVLYPRIEHATNDEAFKDGIERSIANRPWNQQHNAIPDPDTQLKRQETPQYDASRVRG